MLSVVLYMENELQSELSWDRGILLVQKPVFDITIMLFPHNAWVDISNVENYLLGIYSDKLHSSHRAH